MQKIPANTACFCKRYFHCSHNIFAMKKTPFQQILHSEMTRLESVVTNYDRRIGGQIALVRQYRPVKNRHFLLQFLHSKINLRISF